MTPVLPEDHVTRTNDRWDPEVVDPRLVHMPDWSDLPVTWARSNGQHCTRRRILTPSGEIQAEEVHDRLLMEPSRTVHSAPEATAVRRLRLVQP